MEYKQWLKIVNTINANSDLSGSNVIEKVKEKLLIEYKSTYEEWEKNKFDINHKFNNRFTLLNMAAENGHTEIVKTLINKGADVNIVGKEGYTPLHLAAQNGHIEIVKTLLDKGADFNQADEDKWTALHFATQNDRTEIVKTLVNRGADVDVVNKDGITPLHFAAENGSKEIVKTLLDKEANIGAADKDKLTPLHFAVSNGCTEIVNALLDKGANINVADKDGCTPLYLAAVNDEKEIIKVLIAKGADVNVVDQDGIAPLHFATQKGSKEMVNILIDKEVNVNVVDNHGVTPLYWAVKNSHIEIVKALLEKGADPLLGNGDLRVLKPLVKLIKNDSLNHLPEKAGETKQKEEQVNDEYELLKYSLLLHNNRLLIDDEEADVFNDLDVYLTDVPGLTDNQKPLDKELLSILRDFLYCSDGNHNSCILRLKKLLSVENKDLQYILDLGRGKYKLSVLHIISSIDSELTEKFMDLLLEAKANPNVQDANEETPLHYAAGSGCVKGVSLLLKKEARSMPDKKGKTPLQVAIDNHQYDVEELLLTGEQKSLKEKLYKVLKDRNLNELESLLKEHKSNQDLKMILNLHDDEGRSQALQFVRSIPGYSEASCKKVEGLLSEAGAIDYTGLERKESLSQSSILWNNLMLHEQQKLEKFLKAIDEAQDMKVLEQIVAKAIKYGVRLNLPHQGSLYGKAYETKYCFTDYVIKRISDLKRKNSSQAVSDIEIASRIVCDLVSQGAMLYTISSLCIIEDLEEFAGHKDNMKNASICYNNQAKKFVEVAKGATSGKVKDAKIDNSTLYLEYSEDSTVNVAKITDGARDLGLTQGETRYGRDVIKIGKSEVEIITQNDIRYYTDLADGSDIVLTFPTSLGELEVRLYPDKKDQNLIRVEGNKEMLKKLGDCGEEVGKNCRLGGLSVKEAIEQKCFTRSGKLMRFEEMSQHNKQTEKGYWARFEESRRASNCREAVVFKTS